MEVSASQVKELREKTGAGMMDCKKALAESGGDFEKAIEYLRKKGASVATKRSERSTTEGIIITKIFNDGISGAIVEINCETDFVAKSKDFMSFTEAVADVLVAERPSNLADMMNLKIGSKSVEEELAGLIGKIGEKIQISRFRLESASGGMMVDYIHHGSKLGVLIKAENVDRERRDETGHLLKDIAMQVAAMKPLYLNREDVPREIIDKEIEIYKELARKEGKAEGILEKIASGRLIKYYQENCLTDQAFIKDSAKSVGDLIKEFNKKTSGNMRLTAFYRFHVSDENKN